MKRGVKQERDINTVRFHFYTQYYGQHENQHSIIIYNLIKECVSACQNLLQLDVLKRPVVFPVALTRNLNVLGRARDVFQLIKLGRPPWHQHHLRPPIIIQLFEYERWVINTYIYRNAVKSQVYIKTLTVIYFSVSIIVGRLS